MTIADILDIIQDEAREADRRAEHACSRSKYSVQDYHMCTEFYLSDLHDRIAREAGLQRRCPVFPFRTKLAKFRSSIVRDLKVGNGQSDMLAAPDAAEVTEK